MQSRVKYLKLLLPAIFPGLLLISACENDLNKVRAVTAADATKPIQKTTGVTVTYSDSAVLKAVMTAPVLYEYQTKTPYREMPNGVKILFYDKGVQDGQLTADTAIQYDDKQLIVFRKNVVAKKKDGTTYISDELYYDQKAKELYSNKRVVMTKLNGDQTTGTSFKTDDKFKNPIFQNATAIIHVDGDGIAP
jgi:LPS export ABC transporter protein LptC